MLTAFRTDIGRVRTVNEDRAAAAPDINGFALAIAADGMGGHQAGDIASQMAVDGIYEQMQEIRPGMSPEEVEQLLLQSVLETNRRIYEYASANEQYAGMGTTVVVIAATPEELIVGNIGDSRAYLFREGELSQMTEDHSLVNELVRSGQISKEEAARHPRRNVLTRALGTDAHIELDIRRVPWQPGDQVLICSDGLSGMVNERQLSTVLNLEETLDRKAELLIHSALEAGGEDNITAVLLANVPGNLK